MRKLSGMLAIGLFMAASAGVADEPAVTPQMSQTADRLIDGALDDRTGYEVVESLTTEVGPRLAGSAAEARARDWAVDKLKALGFKNVRIEPFEVELWERGVETAEILAPFPQRLIVTALGGSVATPAEGVEGDVVSFPSLAALMAAGEDALAGKIVFVDELMTRTQDGSGYGVAVQKRRLAAFEASKKGAAAVLIRSAGTSSHRFPHAGQMSNEEEGPSVPAAALSAPDADQLARALDRGAVRLRLTLTPESKGLAPSGNVIAEIPGRSRRSSTPTRKGFCAPKPRLFRLSAAPRATWRAAFFSMRIT